jgi:hypothetical protein
MIDPTANETMAMTIGGQQGGRYLESIGKTDLVSLSVTEWDCFVEAVVTGYCDQLRELAAADPAPRNQATPEIPF